MLPDGAVLDTGAADADELLQVQRPEQIAVKNIMVFRLNTLAGGS